MKKRTKTLFGVLLFALLLGGCGTAKEENQTTNTKEELEAEDRIEDQLKETYGEPFEVVFITTLKTGFTGTAVTDDGTEITFTQSEDGTLTTNYTTADFQAPMEDLILQAGMGLEAFKGYSASVVRMEEDAEYPDLAAYLANGEYAVHVTITTDLRGDELTEDLTAFETHMEDAGLSHLLTVNGSLVLDFQHGFEGISQIPEQCEQWESEITDEGAGEPEPERSMIDEETGFPMRESAQ